MKRRFVNIPGAAQSPLNHAVSQRDKTTLQMVREAIKHKQTLLAYQPVVLARDPKRAAFHEGLIRVLDETGRIIPAREFMPVIEDNELGREIDALTLRMGLTALRENPILRLSINMSARSIGYGAWSRTLQNFLASDKTLGERLILEISERSAMVVPELVADFMNGMQPSGICFALDDFGAGQTTIRYFKDFFFDVAKIDGQFIRGISNDADNQVLTATLVAIARQFDMLTVASSVESAEDCAALGQIGVDCMQGYYFAAPTTRPDWLQKTTAKVKG